MHLLRRHVSGANNMHSHYGVSFANLSTSIYVQNSVYCVYFCDILLILLGKLRKSDDTLETGVQGRSIHT